MNKYLDIVGLPALVKACIRGQIQCPLEGYVSPAVWYGFPPALIPIWSNGSRPTYLGYWHHWFANRTPTFVKMYVASDRMTIEIARNLEQFFCICVLSSIVENDSVTDEIKNFANKTGVHNIDLIDRLSLISGDDPKSVIELAQFKKDLPLESVVDCNFYTGEFPTPVLAQDSLWLTNSTSFEISDNVYNAWPSNISIPPWIEKKPSFSKPELFELYLKDEKIDKAWLLLNSTGWSISDAKKALIKISKIVNLPDFNLLREAWISVADESVGGY